MKTLPPLPEALRGKTLRDDEYEWLQAKHNWALSRGPDDCPTCHGRKTFLNAVDDEEYECNCADQWLLFILLAHAGIERRYQEYSWADTENVNPGVLDVARTYKMQIDDFINRGMGLLFVGEDKGTGKTLLATLIAKAAIGKGHSAVFIKYPDMIDMWAEGWTDNGLFERRIKYVDLLVIDDIGREHFNRSHTADVALDAVLRTRVGSLLPTIITTNLSMEQLKKRYSDNIVSLITEAALEVEVAGQDYRPRSLAGSFHEAAKKMTRPVTIG